MGGIRLGEEAVDAGLKLEARHHLVLERRQLAGQIVYPFDQFPHLLLTGLERPVEDRHVVGQRARHAQVLCAI
jgi:hypothetical protein